MASTTYSKETPLHKPTGPHHVTYTQGIFNHTTLDDFTAPNGTGIGTFLLVSIFAPTASVPNQTVRYMDDANAQLWEEALGFPTSSLSSLVTELQYGAPILSNATSHNPTLLFLPGAGLPTLAYTAYLTELASHGHTIITIDHPGEPPYLSLPSSLGGGGIRSAFAPFTSYAWTIPQLQKIYAYRLTDAAAVLSSPTYLRSLHRTLSSPGPAPPLNLTHLSIFGHSIGGAAAAGLIAQSQSESESPPGHTALPTILAGANLDGWFFFNIHDIFPSAPPANTSSSSSSSPSSPYPDLSPAPFLELARSGPGATSAFPSGILAPDATWTNFSAAQTGWLRDVALNGTEHMDFSDVPLWVDVLGLRGSVRSPDGPFLGSIAGRRVTEVVVRFLRGFLGFGGSGGGGRGGNRGEGGLSAVDELVKEIPEAYVRESQDCAGVYVDRGL
ncbi:hypothetical protein B0J12DRAFT_742903 [Macrophomina phaseolina]|uniref:1-alkyl-2-acetylglycerophosphocholine esterase n=1 Tax=Macrophomina phaseolina TaxID=35725 RepID=A0ABQ8G326_9PEZI|nr:hypothetical protein B0J12DRAFT_742903 [Macrophomina phaseolina]